MNNYDRFNEFSNNLEAARFAVSVARGKCSKSGAWEWAYLATKAAELPDSTAGYASWPDLEALERAIDEKSQPALIVTRHKGVVEWLRKTKGIEGEVISHASAENVRGRWVIGALPFHLAALAVKISAIDLPGLPPEKRGAELTAEEMIEFGATLTTYVVKEES